jgi:UTP--glucose-1-phosphate uridylyltransferase
MIRKAVIPAAGFGTRFLPATKSQPKEMLPIVDKPTIQYVVEEAVASGITDILMVIGKGKRAIEEHFDRNAELEAELEAKHREEELQAVRRITSLADIHFVWQKELNGLGGAVACARHHVGREPFAVLLGDVVATTVSGEPLTKQMMSVYDRHEECIVALEEVPWDRVSRYGVVDGESIGGRVFRLTDLIEKPPAEEAPSNMVVAGRYILRPEIFDHLSETPRGRNNEIQLTDALRALVRVRGGYGLLFDGRRYDIGNKAEYIKTNIEFGLMNPSLRSELAAYIKDLARKLE